MKIVQARHSLTPELISGSQTKYSIPMYQRLFEWREPAIEGLLSDLKNAMDIKGVQTPYYIGMLTSTSDNELVDGQQRFSVLTLLGIKMREMSNNEDVKRSWESFLMVDSATPRIYYDARDEDNAYIRWKMGIGQDPNYNNVRMAKGLETIEKFLNEEFENEDSRDAFCLFVFKKLTFFISVLPASYKAKDLNKYFEAMNSTGKNLENHEILKVEMLKTLCPGNNEEHYTRIWNVVSDMDRPLIRKREWLNERDEDWKQRYKAAMRKTRNYDSYSTEEVFANNSNSALINDLTNSEKSFRTDAIEIASIRYAESEEIKKPAEKRLSEGYRSMLSFSEFLLQVLYLVSPPNNQINITDFFDTYLLLSTFDNARMENPAFSSEKFIRALLHYRILYDYFCIRIANNSDDYIIDMQDSDGESDSKKKLWMYESLLYVASSSKSYYLWMATLHSTVSKNPDISCSELLTVLKNRDNEIRDREDLDNPDEKMTYDHIDRYWFWRLDYYIWEDRDALFASDTYFSKFNQFKELVESYTFKRNRSVEHVSPQHPEDEAPIEHLDDFGNLVMISSGLNTTLSNSSYYVKRGHIDDCLSNKNAIESLSMILLYSSNETWGDDEIMERQEQMLKLLKNSFPPSD